MKLGITMLIHNKDDIEFVTEFPCFLGHPVYGINETCENREAQKFFLKIQNIVCSFNFVKKVYDVIF